MKSIDLSKLSIAFTHKDLCTRCGTCVGVCPTRAIHLDAEFYPTLDADKCIECELCAKTCPGGQVLYRDLTEITFGHREDANSFDGHVQRVYVGYSGDPLIRRRGAGGGVVTALLWDLLRRRIVDGCVVTRMHPEKPWQGQVFIARNYEELLESQQSKYIIIPVNAILQELRHLPGRFAIAALPCQIQGLRLLQREKTNLAKKVHAIIGLFCASSLQPWVAQEFLHARGMEPSDVRDFQFRGGDWPGKIRVIMRNGTIHPLHYSNFKDGAINYLTYLYSPPRCQTCIDGSAEFSDISVSDAWTRDASGNYVFKSQSRLLARTDLGVKMMEEAIASESLHASDVTQNSSYQTHKLHTKKKGYKAPIRVARLHREGKVAPTYDRQVPDAASRDVLSERIDSFLMTLGQIRAIRLPLFAFLTSRYGIPFVKVRQLLKRRNYRKK